MGLIGILRRRPRPEVNVSAIIIVMIVSISYPVEFAVGFDACVERLLRRHCSFLCFGDVHWTAQNSTPRSIKMGHAV